MRRVKEVQPVTLDDPNAYDEDDHEQEMSPEDRESMRRATVDVKAAIKDDFIATDEEIQESLWYYYFDVDKTVNYLRGKQKPKQTKQKSAPKPKAESRFDKAAAAANERHDHDLSFNKPSQVESTRTLPLDASTSLQDGPESGLNELSTEQHTKVTRKNLNVLQEYQRSNMKKSASFVVVGHVDHGKSTLMGRLLYDLKVVNDKTVNKYKRDSEKIGKGSFALAWVMDATSDERERGVTVDTATKHFETEKTKFTILDAPGHQDFIPNMIAGASQADFAVLVIDSGTNSFESGLRGQTKEHAILVRSLGVQKLIVAVNKMDKVNWSQERFNEIQQEMSTFLTSANFPASAVSFIPCAGLTGENVLERPTNPLAVWYKGPTLVEELDSIEGSKRMINQSLRMTISEVIRTLASSAPTVSGRLETGSIQVGDTVVIQPSGQTATIKSIEEHNSTRDWAIAGQMVTLRLVQIDSIHVHTGDVLCDAEDVVRNVSTFSAKILTFEHVMPMFIEVHRGRMHASGKISKLVATLDRSTGKISKKSPRIIPPGNAARVQIELELPMPLEATWKIILRAEGRSVAAGIVE